MTANSADFEALPAPKPATAYTKREQQRICAELDFKEDTAFADATRGFIAPLPDNGRLPGENGRPVWFADEFAFVRGDAPETVNPSLWRQAKLVMEGGLFKVCERIYQVRNYDLANLTIIEGDTGLILVDPLMARETASAALALYYAHRPRKPVVAVIYSHSHTDHYGGVRGVIDEKDVNDGTIALIAPAGFMEEAVSETILAGNAMKRRAAFMFGRLLPPSPTGNVGAGLGLTVPRSQTTLIAPTTYIARKRERLVLDGLTFEFLLTPDTEAPAEMHWYIPELKAVSAAENYSKTMHNVYTLRGAKTRDALAWANALDDTVKLWGHEAEVLYGTHHWPVWGNDRIRACLELSRDGYRFIHDQTLHWANKGYTMTEIAEKLRFPPELARHWDMRGYYGSLSHNVKGTYCKFLGWFDGNPAHLHRLPEREAAVKYVEYMGGADAVLAKAEKSYALGEYRWVAEVLSHVIRVDPSNKRARAMEADALEQMGYQAESAPWRNFYLSGARELRQGVAALPSPPMNIDTLRALPPGLLFDYMAVRLNAERAAGRRIRLNIALTDEPSYFLELRNSVLHHGEGALAEPDAALSLPRMGLALLALGTKDLDEVCEMFPCVVRGDRKKVDELLRLLDRFVPDFPLVLPRDAEM